MTTTRLMLGVLVGLQMSVLSAVPYVVEAGDSLSQIAQMQKTTVAALKELNALEGDLIRVGQMLKLPEELEQEPDPEENEQAKSEDGDILLLQVKLDRAGFGPGKIDGMSGRFTKQALEYCREWKPEALVQEISATQRIAFDVTWEEFVNRELPGSGVSPDFKALSVEKPTLLYYSMAEFLAERFHCSEKLLAGLNPKLDLEALTTGQQLVVPNVVPFEIERYLSSEGVGQWTKLVGHGKKGRVTEISKAENFLKLWEDERLVRAFPVTVNRSKTPIGRRKLGDIVPGSPYYRKKTGLDLSPGPNSPVGVIWCSLGDGIGIHGTNNPDSIGRSVSSGCIRLANWDVAKLAGMLQKGGEVVLGDFERHNLVQPSHEVRCLSQIQ